MISLSKLKYILIYFLFITIFDGIGRLSVISHASSGDVEYFVGFAGLNNGNGRGSMDSFWIPTGLLQEGDDDGE